MKYLSPKEFAERYSLNQNSLRNALRSGKVPGAIKVIRQWRIPENAFTEPQNKDEQ